MSYGRIAADNCRLQKMSCRFAKGDLRMTIIRKSLGKATPVQLLVMGFVLVILTGAILLALPISSSKGDWGPFIDALFTATSAISTTGLTVVDTGSYYSLFGQIVVLVLIQIGGLGYMVLIAFAAYAMGRKLSAPAAKVFQESLSGVSFDTAKRFALLTILFTFLFEFAGAVILSLYWMRQFSIWRSIYLGAFHSISGFCTAGFGLFSDNMCSCRPSVVVNLTVCLICIAGGIGFFVLIEAIDLLRKIARHRYPRRLSTHTRLALTASVVLMAGGAAIIFFAERPGSGQGLGERLLVSVFQSVSASTTTGYNTADIGAMSSTSLLTMIFLMFVGASPGGTGGGIKTTTFAALLLLLLSQWRGRQEVVMCGRQIPDSVLRRASAVALSAVLLVVCVTLVLTVSEKASFLQDLFEVVSGFGNVGLSTGITPSLTAAGKLMIILTMLAGRVGPLAMGFALVGRPEPSRVSYPRGEVYVG